MQCHRCRHNADVQGGRFKGVPFEETPCARCRLRHDSSHVLPFKPEVVAGEIRHAIRFTVSRSQQGYIHPETHAAGDSSTTLPPM